MPALRIAIFQIRCHPALYAGHINYPEEPFVPAPGETSLSQLGAKGVLVDPLHEYCLQEYSRWERARISSVLDCVSGFGRRPDIVVFPEYSIPIGTLPDLSQWSGETGATVLAGTHTPLVSVEAKSAYAQIGISSAHVDRVSHRSNACVLPLIIAGKARLLRKKSSSPLEFSVASRNSSKTGRPTIRSYKIEPHEDGVQLAPLICAEALQQPRLPKKLDVAAVVSYDNNPEQFRSFVTDTIRNRSSVLYCNDGAYGGSNIYTVQDRRVPNWFRDALPHGLPPGDSVLIADISTEVGAVEVGTAIPKVGLKMVAVMSFLYESPTDVEIIEAVDNIRRMPSADARAMELESLARILPITDLQRFKVEYLAKMDRRGVNSSDWWNVLGQDHLCRGVISLKALEARMATRCRDELIKNGLASVLNKPSAAPAMVEFLNRCQRESGTSVSTRIPNDARDVDIFDRDEDARKICAFLDSRTHNVLEVTGLPQIGKTLAIDKAINKHGNANELTIPLSYTSSIDYIIYSILKTTISPKEPPFQNPLAMIGDLQARRAMSALDVMRIQNTHCLLDHGSWREKIAPKFLVELIEQAAECSTKIILEGQRTLPLDIGDPTRRDIVRVSGLTEVHAIDYLNSRLRKIGLPIDILVKRDKRSLIKKLGGHPVALTIAADAMFEDGAKSTLKKIINRRGFYLNFLNTLVAKLQLTDEENEILRLACLARSELAREALAESVDFNPTRHTRNLLNLGALEIGRRGLVRISPLLREYFDPEVLPPEKREVFHLGAAKSLQQYADDFDDLPFEIEAKYHAGFTDWDFPTNYRLVDGALATANSLFDQHQYDRARDLVDLLLEQSRSLDVLRLGARVYAKLNDFDVALAYAREVFSQNRHDTWLLSQLARTALTQSRLDVSKELIRTAKQAGLEDVSILLVEGRMHLRRHKLDDAEEAFSRAKQLTERNPWPFFYLGRTYVVMGRLDEAIDVLFDGEQFIHDKPRRNKNALNAIRTQLGVAYLYDDRIDLAAPIIESLFEDNPNSPEVIRAYAALTIKRDGIEDAHRALEKLREARIKSRHDRCQFHLLYGLFCLGIGDRSGAAREFGRAHEADRSNVFVMIKQAQTLLDIAVEQWAEGLSSHKEYVADCRDLIRQILKFDVDNEKGLQLMHELRKHFGVDFD